MEKNDSVYKEALKVSVTVFIMGVIEFILFAIFMHLRTDILLGTLYGCTFVCLNFFYLARCVKKAADKSPNAAKAYMASTYTVRMLFTAAAVIFAVNSPYIHFWAAIIPLFFQRIAVTIVPFINKRSEKS